MEKLWNVSRLTAKTVSPTPFHLLETFNFPHSVKLSGLLRKSAGHTNSILYIRSRPGRSSIFTNYKLTNWWNRLIPPPLPTQRGGRWRLLINLSRRVSQLHTQDHPLALAQPFPFHSVHRMISIQPSASTEPEPNNKIPNSLLPHCVPVADAREVYKVKHIIATWISCYLSLD